MTRSETHSVLASMEEHATADCSMLQRRAWDAVVSIELLGWEDAVDEVP